MKSEESAVLCGDFNIVPSALDSWNEEEFNGSIFHTDAERERMAAFDTLGLRDLFRHLAPEERAFSWWDYRGGSFHRKRGLRIDFLLGTNRVVQTVEICGNRSRLPKENRWPNGVGSRAGHRRP